MAVTPELAELARLFNAADYERYMAEWCDYCGTSHRNELVYKECARMQADGELPEPA